MEKRSTRKKQRAICGICPAGCWVRVETEKGRLVGIEADEGHPLGMLCERGRHAPEIVHSEHRLTRPLRRTGPKGSFDFEPIGWDEAYETIVGRLGEIRDASGPEATAIYTGRGAFELSLCDVYQPAGVSVSSASSVLFPFGSPNTMGVGALCYVSFAMIAPHVTLGRTLVDLYSDIENASLLVVWGANPATDSPPLDMERLEAAARRGAEVVVIDPRHTETARRTGAEWIPIRPGTDGALALAMLQVMLEEELHDEAFAERWTHGFDDLARYVQHFRPEQVAPITGVPAGTIRQLARRIATARGACPIMYTGLEYSNTGLQAVRAVQTLFALAGHLDVPGGIGLAMPGSHFPINRSGHVANPDLDRAAGYRRFPLYSRYRGESHAAALVDSVLHGDPYRIRALLIHGASLLTSWPETRVWRETLAGLDFVVTIDRQLTADAAYADVVLPATTMFEIDSYMTYGPIFRLRERVVPPVGEARSDSLIMAELARRLGYGHLYPQSEEAVLRHVLEGSGFTLEEVRARGGTVQIDTPLMSYRKWEKGLLRPDGEPGFDTPTGRFEIASTILEEHGYEPLPKYVEPVEGPLSRPDLTPDFPLVFNSGARTQTDFRSQHHGVPGLTEGHPEPTVDLHPDDAGPRGIEDGDLVEVRTPRGAVPFRARVSEAIVPGAVECSMGGGTPVGPPAWNAWNANELTDLGNYDGISGFPVYKALLCEVRRLEQGAGTARAGGRPGATREPPPAPTAAARPEAPPPRIYLDENATTRLHPQVAEAMRPWLGERFGNPSSLYAEGRGAHEAVEAARRQVAALVHAGPRRVVFTGGGSEADNLALKGVAFGARRPGRLVVSAVEHPAVLRTADFLEGLGWEVLRLAPDEGGLVAPEALDRALAGGADLVSIMLANNEIGTLQPVAELARVAHAHGALFHTDAVQAAGKVPLDVGALEVDLLTLSSHKLRGPQGVGALYVRKGLGLVPLVHGGGQEGGRRAGTENVAGIVGMGRAAELALEAVREAPRLAALRDRLEAGLCRLWPKARVNGAGRPRLPGTSSLTLPGLRGEAVVLALDRHGIALSSGSACKAGAPEPSHVLLALGRTEEEAHCTVRFSLPPSTTEADVDRALAAFGRVLEEMETTVRFLPCK